MSDQDDAKSGPTGKKIWPTVVKWMKRLLVLAVSSAILLLGLDFFEQYQREQEKERREQAEEREKSRVEGIVLAAQGIDNQSKARDIIGNTQPDPASGTQIVRGVKIYSEDGLCNIDVELRLDGTALTGIYCPNININPRDDLWVKFDTDDVSMAVDLKYFSGSDNVYITGSYSFAYSAFVNKLRCSNSLALKIPAAYSFWTRFDLSGTSTPIGQLGKGRDFKPDPCENKKNKIFKPDLSSMFEVLND